MRNILQEVRIKRKVETLIEQGVPETKVKMIFDGKEASVDRILKKIHRIQDEGIFKQIGRTK